MRRTLVTFHAHPDDEAIATGGTIARAAADGHRVVLVVATRGELGETPPGVDPGPALGVLREEETRRAAEILGVSRVAFLGYHDSGMAGTPANTAAAAFAAAPVDEAAARLAAILREERAGVLTVYDAHGGYGHPDHVQVHRVGHRAADLAGTPDVFEATLNRDHIRRLLARFAEEVPDAERPGPEDAEIGLPESQLTTGVDVRDLVDVKRAAMAAHASQIGEQSFFLSLPPDAFREAFGWEWFARRGAAPGLREHSLFEPAAG